MGGWLIAILRLLGLDGDPPFNPRSVPVSWAVTTRRIYWTDQAE